MDSIPLTEKQLLRHNRNLRLVKAYNEMLAVDVSPTNAVVWLGDEFGLTDRAIWKILCSYKKYVVKPKPFNYET